ncbi:C1 family peptidase [Roseateles sp.]|uniref:C1 family peptidase n=1 Tax=Roseateles sp. TaxID=1971397 RepID=UPI00286CE181|nr:C1 family peptidase [Roseateles sp.]
MPANDYDDLANQASGFSGFGGHLLADPEGDGVAASLGSEGQALVSTLLSLGIEDAEQVVAVAAIPAVRGELQQVLGLKDKAFQNFLDNVQAMLPATRAAELSTPKPKDLGLGVRAPTPEMLSAAEASAIEVVERSETVELPGLVNLVGFFQPIRNQGPRGTCVSFTLTALNEYIERRRGIQRNLSEQHLYYETKLIDGAAASCGTWQAKARLPLASRGQCREVVWAYRNALPCNNHGARPAGARPDGLTNRLATLAVPTRNVLAYKTHMSKQRPIGLSIPVYNSWYQSAATRQTGRITMRIGNEAAVGGHAVLLVGYVDTPASPGGGYFIVRNSWGTASFGSANPFGAGYGTIPYQYITNDAWEAFTAVVPGINSVEDTDEAEDVTDDDTTTGTSVTIDVGPNIKITIQSR